MIESNSGMEDSVTPYLTKIYDMNVNRQEEILGCTEMASDNSGAMFVSEKAVSGARLFSLITDRAIYLYRTYFPDERGAKVYKCVKVNEEYALMDFLHCFNSYDNLSKLDITDDDGFEAISENTFIVFLKKGILLFQFGSFSTHVIYVGKDDVEVVKAFITSHTKEAACEDDGKDKISYGLVVKAPSGYMVQNLYLDDMHVDISKNYNDDFDYQRLVSTQYEDNGTLTLLHGAPGGGKTTVLKELIKDICKDKKVFYMDGNLLSSFSDASFVSFVLGSLSGNVLILEDCEKILADRNGIHSSLITSLLNFTDGFLGASIKPHFICTFNCPLSKIDKAMLRKGRLKYRYEFKKLSLDKCREINPLADKPMLLSDLYNLGQEVCAQSACDHKIGFN